MSSNKNSLANLRKKYPYWIEVFMSQSSKYSYGEIKDEDLFYNEFTDIMMSATYKRYGCLMCRDIDSLLAIVIRIINLNENDVVSAEIIPGKDIIQTYFGGGVYYSMYLPEEMGKIRVNLQNNMFRENLAIGKLNISYGYFTNPTDFTYEFDAGQIVGYTVRPYCENIVHFENICLQSSMENIFQTVVTAVKGYKIQKLAAIFFRQQLSQPDKDILRLDINDFVYKIKEEYIDVEFYILNVYGKSRAEIYEMSKRFKKDITPLQIKRQNLEEKKIYKKEWKKQIIEIFDGVYTTTQLPFDVSRYMFEFLA